MCTQAKYSRNKSLLAGWLAHTKMQKVFIFSKTKEKKETTTKLVSVLNLVYSNCAMVCTGAILLHKGALQKSTT